MFSNLSSSSISLATVTPSLVMRGAPKLLSSTTLRPLGPSVTRTALLRISTPRSIFSRASPENLTSLAAILLMSLLMTWTSCGESGRKPFARVRCPVRLESAEERGSGGLLAGDLFGQHAHDVALFHDEIFDAIELDLGAGPFSEQHPIAGLEIDGDQLAALVASARTHRNDLALLRLFLGGVGDDDAAGGLFLGIDALDDNTVVKRTKLHRSPPKILKGCEISERLVSRQRTRRAPPRRDLLAPNGLARGARGEL